MKNISLVLAVSLFCLAGCSGPRDKNPTQTTSPQGANSPSANAAPGAQPWQSPASPASSGASAGVNPPHGEPGHRCDIQVGAPLNSAPAQAPVISSGTPAPVPQAPMPQAPVLPSAPPISTAKGLNPPHGQPGHDCAVPVGSPLPK